AAVELRGVEAELHGMLLEVGVGEARRAGEELVVIRPEFALFSRALRRFRGRPRVRVTWERKVTVDEMDAIAVGAEHLLDRRISALAVGTLEIGELDNLDRRRLRALPLGIRRGDVLSRRLEHHAHRRLPLERVDELLTRRLHPFLSEISANRLADLIECGALDPALVALVPGGNRLIVHRLNLRGDLVFNELGALDAARPGFLIEQRVGDEIVNRAAPGFVERLRQLQAAEAGDRLLP